MIQATRNTRGILLFYISLYVEIFLKPLEARKKATSEPAINNGHRHRSVRRGAAQPDAGCFVISRPPFSGGAQSPPLRVLTTNYQLRN